MPVDEGKSETMLYQKKTGLYSFLSSGSALAIVVAALIFTIVSICIFWLATLLESNESWKVLAGPLRHTAQLLLTVGGLQFLLRTKIWKDATESMSDRLQAKQATVDSGLVHYWQYDAVPWADLFEGVFEVTIVAISARSILVERIATIRAFLARPKTKLRIILSDYNDLELMARFDAEFKEPAGTRAQKLREAIGELMKAIEPMPAETRARVEIRLSPSRAPYSIYRFGGQILFVPYMMEPVRDASRIPALLFGDGGMAAKYLLPDLNYLLKTPPVAHGALKNP